MRETYRDAVAEDLARVTDFDEDTILLLARTGRPINIPAGWAVIVQNTPPDKAYIILDGQVEIRRDERVIATLQAGDVIGEIAILGGSFRTATVVAVSPVRALHFTDEEFATVVSEDPDFSERLRHGYADRIVS